MLDGIELKGAVTSSRSGSGPDGMKIPLERRDGSSERGEAAADEVGEQLLRDGGVPRPRRALRDRDRPTVKRRLRQEGPGRSTITTGPSASCENVFDHLAERLSVAYITLDRGTCPSTSSIALLSALAPSNTRLERSHPGAAASLREGMAKTLAVTDSGSWAR